jgi:hypothetical protein
MGRYPRTGILIYKHDPGDEGVYIEERAGEFNIVAYNQGGHDFTSVPLAVVLDWVRVHRPDLLERQPKDSPWPGSIRERVDGPDQDEYEWTETQADIAHGGMPTPPGQGWEFVEEIRSGRVQAFRWRRRAR